MASAQSTLSKTQRAAVAMLPLVLLPEIMLSRAAYGHGGHVWSDNSPFAPIVATHVYVRSDECDRAGATILIASLPLITRPATTVLDAFGDVRHVRGGRRFAEWAYLGLLTTGHLALLYVVFLRWEHRWLVRN